MKEKIITRIKCPCGKSHAPESKTLADHVIKYNPKEIETKPHKDTPLKPTEPTESIDLVFLNRIGKETPVKSIIKQEECWPLEKRGQKMKQWILSHAAVMKIATEAGISKNYEVKESDHVIPKPENALLHVVEITIHCSAKVTTNPESCVHDSQNWLRMTGEASKQNTGRGKDYLRTMAEKRGYDRAVLRHIGVENVYSEEEASAFESEEEKQKVDVLTTEELEKISTFVNALLNAKTADELKAAGKQIALNKAQLNENQIQFLRERYSKKDSKFNKAF